MSQVDFIIPTKLEDLCCYSNDRYVVNADFTPEEVIQKVPDLYNKLVENGSSFILDEFDVFYGVLK